MTTVRWGSGDRWAIAAGGSFLLLQQADAATAERCHAALAGDVGAVAVLGLLASPAGLLDLPPFALLVCERDGARLLVRELDAVVDGEAVHSTGVLTWVEHVVPRDATVRVGDAGEALLPGTMLRDGIVRCGPVEATTAAGAGSSGPGGADRAAAPPANPRTSIAPAPLPPAPAPAVAEAPRSAPAPRPEPEPAEPVPPAIVDVGATLVESVPSLLAASQGPDAPAREETAELTGLTELLRGAAVERPLAEAARWPDAVVAESPPSAQDDGDPDHDGMTAMLSDVLRSEPRAPHAASAGAGSVSLADGRTWQVDRPIVVGRRPQADRVAAGALPHLITVESPEQDVSRSHVEIRPEGGRAVAADLGTTNGTTLHRAGKPPRRLSSHDRHVLADGDVLDLGEGVLLTYRTDEGTR